MSAANAGKTQRAAKKNLVIVESPAKAKTIKKYLGKNYEVIASEGHVRDLPKSKMGIDIDNDFEPEYITIRGKGTLLAKLRKEVKKADMIYLATDPDREGEAISYHLSIALKLDEEGKKYKRITFNEITKSAVRDSLKNAREIDMDLVDAQQARRVLDRLVGYSISPILWEKIKKGLSAGRVQSAALKMIYDRENEINAFDPEEYWTLDALADIGGKTPAAFSYTGKLKSETDTDAVIGSISGKDFTVSEVKSTEKSRKAPLPFTTSTLQQTASRKLSYTPSRVMSIAQRLYENGYITYLRTDSTRISDEADKAAREYISSNFGEEYLSQTVSVKKDNAKIQDAHEAIRPTSPENTPQSLKGKLPNDEYKLYNLIYSRFLGSRMAPARYETLSVTIKAGDAAFRLSASNITFKGFLSVYTADETKDESVKNLDKLKEGDKVSVKDLDKKQHFTQPPAHYTEALLVKAMEENGIGRPSTYAPTINTIMGRHYVIKENKNLYITELGEGVNGIMEKAFPEIIDISFTANMEQLLDNVGEGEIDWKTLIRNFYPDLKDEIDSAADTLEHIKIADEVSDTKCEQCGRMMVIKYGPHGKFLACPGFPECRNTKPYFEKTGISCPKCGGDIVIKHTKKGRRYFGCSNAPECDFMSWKKPE